MKPPVLTWVDFWRQAKIAAAGAAIARRNGQPHAALLWRRQSARALQQAWRMRALGGAVWPSPGATRWREPRDIRVQREQRR